MTSSALNDDQLHRFSRQLILSGFDDEAQCRLLSAHVLIIGAGGLGAPVIQYLAAAGVGTMTIIDGDVVELSNLNRQVIHSTESVGRYKVSSAKQAALALNPQIEVHAHHHQLNSHDDDILSTLSLDEIGLIIDCSDNASTRHIVNRIAHDNGITLIFGGATRLEGQIATFKSGVSNDSPCYRCLFPADAQPGLVSGCSEAGILGAITGIIGSIISLEAIKQIISPNDCLGASLDGKLMLVDGFSLITQNIAVEKRSNCPVCA